MVSGTMLEGAENKADAACFAPDTLGDQKMKMHRYLISQTYLPKELTSASKTYNKLRFTVEPNETCSKTWPNR